MRRNLVRVLIGLAIVAVLGVAGYVVYNSQFRTRTLVMGTGPKSGQAYIFGEAIAKLVAAHSPRTRIQVMETGGAAENMTLLRQRKIDLAISQNDVPGIPEGRAVVNLYPEVFHLIAADASGIMNVEDMVGKRIGTTPEGSGSYGSFLLLLQHYGLKPDQFTFVTVASDDLTKAFLDGQLDLVFRNLPIGDNRVQPLMQGVAAHLVPIDQPEAMQLYLPYMEIFSIPRGAYKAIPAVPAEDLSTVGVYCTLVAHEQADSELVRTLTGCLFDYRQELIKDVPLAAFISSPLETRSVGMSVHPGAGSYYNRDEPSFLEKYTDLIGLFITLATLAGSGFLAVRSRLQQGQKSRAEQYSVEIANLLEQTSHVSNAKDLEMLRSELHQMFKQVIDDLNAGKVTGEAVQSFTVTWDAAMSNLRHREVLLYRDADAGASTA